MASDAIDVATWILLLLMGAAVALFILLFVAGAIGAGLALSIVLRSQPIVLAGAFTVTLLLIAVDIVYQVLYDIGGRTYVRYSLWLSLPWTVLSLTWLGGVGLAFGNAVFHWRIVRFRALWPLAVHVVGAVIFWGLWALTDGLSTHSDATMIRHFRRHEAEFNQLAAMFAQEGGVSAICGTYAISRGRLPAERIAEYEALLRAVDIRHGITREPRGQTLFRYWSMPEGGFAGQNIEKGYAPLEESPEHLTESLDGSRWNGQGIVYRHVEGRWYLYYFNRDSLRGSCDYGR